MIFSLADSYQFAGRNSVIRNTRRRLPLMSKGRFLDTPSPLARGSGRLGMTRLISTSQNQACSGMLLGHATP